GMQASRGAGSRHFDFHPNGRWVYSLNEEASTLDYASYDAGTGTLALRQTVSTLPPGYEGTNYTSEIHVSSDGRFVYVANRLHNSIAVLAINQIDGSATWLKEFWTQGDYPRHFGIEPNGNFMYVLHFRNDNITTFGIGRGTGHLEFPGQFTGAVNPSKIVFLAL